LIRLLDTNTCIQLWQRKNKAVRARFERFAPNEIALCSVVKAELIFGAHKSERSVSNLLLLEKLFAPIASFSFDDKAAFHYGKIRFDLSSTGQMIGANDLVIAAIALANNLTLVTHNTSEFSRVIGLALEDWEG
jgi:tRNA(fMet)-specific endonuclease VapC